MSGGNQVGGRAYSSARHWREFDALTPRLRRLMAHAPYDYTTNWVLKDLRAYGEARTADLFVAAVFRDRDRELRKVWSSDHPMIGSRTAERRVRR